MRGRRQSVRKLLRFLYIGILLLSLSKFLWDAVLPTQTPPTPTVYQAKDNDFMLSPLPTLSPDSVLNTGEAAALDALPGIGEVLAGRIVAYREEHGAFVYPEDLMNVKGIGENLLAQIRDALDDEATSLPVEETHVPEMTPVPRATLPPDSILNTGDAAALDALPGIGKVLAGRIVAYREEHGKFVYPEDLLNVKGIGEKKLQAILEALGEERSE